MKGLPAKIAGLFTLGALLLTPFAAAQTPSPSEVVPSPTAPTPSPSATAASTGGDKLPISDLLSWELGLAENAFLNMRNVKNKQRLLAVYEKVTAAICMPNLHKVLEHEGSPDYPKCPEFIKKTLELDPANPIAICARDGIKSVLCRATNHHTTFSTFHPESEEQLGIASLDDILENKKNRQQIADESLKLSNELQQLSKVEPKRRKAAHIKRMNEIHSSLLKLQCRNWRVILNQTDQDVAREFEEKQGNEDDRFADSASAARAATASAQESVLLRKIAEEFEITEALKQLPESKRIYQVSTECDRHIESALKFNKNHATAICYRYGFYSPQCVEALKAQRDAQGDSFEQSDDPNTPTGGFDKF
ncbi:MAG: hypothetical protein J5J00_04775 [Deltaproteobacteria bacterium]|nr:hypothetical protein [Deltaproteobacteria bacterium]